MRVFDHLVFFAILIIECIVDEFAMLYATAGILYGALSITLGSSVRRTVAALLTAGVIALSIAHTFLGNVTVFRLTWLAMLLTVTSQLIYLVSAKVPDKKVASEVKLLATYGGVTFVSGWLIWNVDMHLCDYLASAREVIGLPIGILTEFHGWYVFPRCTLRIFTVSLD